MTNLFYFLIFFAIAFEGMSLSSPKRVHAFSNKAVKVKYPEMTSTQKSFLWCQLCYTTWCFIGLFTFQWPIFLVIIITSFIPKKHWILRMIDAGITLCLLFFILINKYHLNINIWEFISNRF